MASTPQFTGVPRVAHIRTSAGNSARDGSGVLYTLDIGRANGTLVTWLRFQAIGPTTPGVLRAFIDGQLFAEVATTGGNPTGISAGEVHDVVFSSLQPLVLGEGQTLQVATNNAETWNVLGFMGDF